MFRVLLFVLLEVRKEVIGVDKDTTIHNRLGENPSLVWVRNVIPVANVFRRVWPGTVEEMFAEEFELGDLGIGVVGVVKVVDLFNGIKSQSQSIFLVVVQRILVEFGLNGIDEEAILVDGGAELEEF
mgnify:CR=1 FL=1